MKPRRVFVTLEVVTDAPLSKLKKSMTWTWDASWCGYKLKCLQVSANVAQKIKKGRSRK